MGRGKAFSLLSGGLDSLLATRLIMDQGIEVTGLHFITPFFGYSKKGQEAQFEERWKRLYGIQARIIDVSEEYFQVLRHPRYGYGKNFNPCIDCKIFLFSQAKSPDGGRKSGLFGHWGSVRAATHVPAQGYLADCRTGFRDRRIPPPAPLCQKPQAHPPGVGRPGGSGETSRSQEGAAVNRR